MARETLDRKLRHLFDEFLIMDSMVEQAIIESVDALKLRNLDLAKKVYMGDELINKKRFELENDILITIATQQPIMATDLRTMASLLEVTGEMERIGDYAKGIAKICLRIGQEPHVKPLIDIPKMCEIVVDMLHQAITAFVSHDLELSRAIPSRDNEVDALYNQVYNDLIQIMTADITKIDNANYLMWVAHNLERMADRVTNICERSIYIITGQLIEIDKSDDETLLERG